MRTIIRSIVLDILSSFAKISDGVHILNGHYISTGDETPSKFDALLRKLSEKAQIINIDDAVEMISRRDIPRRQKFISFTFDDGFEECFTKIKPVLDSFNAKAAFFINPGFVEGDEAYRANFTRNVVMLPRHKNPMSWEQIRQLLAEGHVIGSHSMDHMRLNTADKSILREQITKCKEVLEHKLNYQCNYFAYPYGLLKDISKEAIAIAEKDYTYCFTQTNHRRYFSFEGRFINRRHFEGNWKYRHVKYFLNKESIQA